MELKEGDMAPAFSLSDQHGAVHRLSDYKGKKVALYFYPKDDTPGCTTQGCSIRDNYAGLKKKGIIVLGVSKDSIERHKKFADKYRFNFPILSDGKMETLQNYGVWKEKSMYGRTFLGVVRTTFLINGDGRIVKIIAKPDTSNHAEEIMKGFGA